MDEEDLFKEFIDILNNLEYNSNQVNLDCWDGMGEDFKKILEAIENAETLEKLQEEDMEVEN